MKRLLKEPLLHFLVLGVVMFAIYSRASKHSSNEPRQIVVSQGQIASMVAGFTGTWQRPPTSAELEGLIQDRVREEVYSREALALGLDKDDTVIRRRLRQKMEFVTDDITAQAEPTDDDLGTYLNAHPDSFRVQRLFTFSQVYLNPDLHGEHLTHDAAQLLAQLNQSGGNADVSALGDPFLLDRQFDALPAGEATKLFGEKFAATLGELAPGHWQGPLESGYGVHLVFISERTEGRLSALAEVRDDVRREWANARRREANETLYEAMRKRYVVTVESPRAAEGTTVAEAKAK